MGRGLKGVGPLPDPFQTPFAYTGGHVDVSQTSSGFPYALLSQAQTLWRVRQNHLGQATIFQDPFLLARSSSHFAKGGVSRGVFPHKLDVQTPPRQERQKGLRWGSVLKPEKPFPTSTAVRGVGVKCFRGVQKGVVYISPEINYRAIARRHSFKTRRTPAASIT